MRASGGEAEVVVCDVTLAGSCESACAAAGKWLGGLDILVNNVGFGGGMGRFEETEPAAWQATIDRNIGSVFNMTRAALPLILADGGADRDKAIVNISWWPGSLPTAPQLTARPRRR